MIRQIIDRKVVSLGKSKFYEFEAANGYIVNKDKALNSYIIHMLNRTQSMFKYEGLPDTIPASALESMLQTKGYAFITEVNDKLYALYGSLGGEPDPYDDFTTITVANVALKISKTFNLQEDGVLMNSDSMRTGLLPILKKYGCLLVENTISMRTVDIMLRMLSLISAPDDRTKNSADKYMKDLEDGKISVIGESAFFDGIRLQSVANSQNYMIQFIEMEQYIKASCFNEIGLNANFNMKREYIGQQESSLNDDFLLPLVDNMIKERQKALKLINDKYGTNITIDYDSAWKVTHAENEKEITLSETLTEEGELHVVGGNEHGSGDQEGEQGSASTSEQPEDVQTDEQSEGEQSSPADSEPAADDNQTEGQEDDDGQESDDQDTGSNNSDQSEAQGSNQQREIEADDEEDEK